MNTLPLSDVNLSKGIKPALDPKRAVRCAVTGAVIGHWSGAVVKGSK